VCCHINPILETMPKAILQIKDFLQLARRKDAKAVKVMKRTKSGYTKFKIRCSRVRLLLRHAGLSPAHTAAAAAVAQLRRGFDRPVGLGASLLSLPSSLSAVPTRRGFSSFPTFLTLCPPPPLFLIPVSVHVEGDGRGEGEQVRKLPAPGPDAEGHLTLLTTPVHSQSSFAALLPSLLGSLPLRQWRT
jgi:hypothetical protein